MDNKEYEQFKTRVATFFKDKGSLARMKVGQALDQFQGEGIEKLQEAFELSGDIGQADANAVSQMKKGARAARYYITFYYWLLKTKLGSGYTHETDIIVFGKIIRTKSDLRNYLEDNHRQLDSPETASDAPSISFLEQEIKHVAPRFSQSRLPKIDGKIFGRDDVLETLNAHLMSGNANIISLVAPGGVGKTAVLRSFLTKMSSERWSNLECVFEWSFYNQGVSAQGANSEEFFREASNFFKLDCSDKMTEMERGIRLAAIVSQSKCLLILDGLEPLQHPPGQLGGRLTDIGIEAFLVSLAKFNNGLCLITSRLNVADLNDYAPHVFVQLELDNLNLESSISVLQELGVTGQAEVISEAAEAVDRQALALNLLAHWLREFRGGDAKRHREIDFARSVERTGGHAWRILEKYHDWLLPIDGLILEFMGFFDRPASNDELNMLIQLAIGSGFDDKLQLRDQSEIQNSIRRLRSIALLNYGIIDDQLLDCHPLIREYESIRIESQNINFWRAGHAELFHRLVDSVTANPQSTTEITALYQAVSHACKANLYLDAWSQVVKPLIWKDNHFSVNQLGLISAELSMLRNFFSDEEFMNVHHEFSDTEKGQLLSQTAFMLSCVEQLRKARDVQQHCFALRCKTHEWDEANISLGCAAEYSYFLGDLDTARSLSARAFEIGDRGDMTRWHIAARCTAGILSYEMADDLDALSHFASADELLASQPSPSKWPQRASGFNYCYFKLSQLDEKFKHQQWSGNDDFHDFGLDTQELIDWSEWCIAQNNASDHYIPFYDGIFRICLGKAYLFQSIAEGKEATKAINCLHEAIRYLAKSGVERYQGLAYAALISAYGRQLEIQGFKDEQLTKNLSETYEKVERSFRRGALIRTQLTYYLEKMTIEQRHSLMSGIPLPKKFAKSAAELAFRHRFFKKMNMFEALIAAID